MIGYFTSIMQMVVFSLVAGERVISHRALVPNLRIGFILYVKKPNIQTLTFLIKKKYGISGSQKKHVLFDSMKSFEEFVFSLCISMG